MVKKINYAVVDKINTFTIARAANLWAGYPPAFAAYDKPIIAGEPAPDQSAGPLRAMGSAAEFLAECLADSSYDIATAMKLAAIEGRLGKHDPEPKMATVRTRQEYRGFALGMHERAGWSLPAFLFPEVRILTQKRGEKSTTRSLKGLVAIIADDLGMQELTLPAARQWLCDDAHDDFRRWEEELARVGITGLAYNADTEEISIDYEPEGGDQEMLAIRKLRSLGRYITGFNRGEPVHFK